MNFKILLVNGRDLSGSSQKDAVAAFEAASEPISVVLTRGGSSSPATMFKGVEVGTQTEVPYCFNCQCQYSAFAARCKSLAKSLTALMRFQKAVQGRPERIEMPASANCSDEDDDEIDEECQEMWGEILHDDMDGGVITDALHHNNNNNDENFSSCSCDVCLISESRAFEEYCFENVDLEEDVSPITCRRYEEAFNSSLKGLSSFCTDTNGKDSGVGRTDESISNSEKGSPANTLLSPVNEDVFDSYSTKSDSDACVSANDEFFFEKFNQSSVATGKADIDELTTSQKSSLNTEFCVAPGHENTLEQLQSEMHNLDIVSDRIKKTRMALGTRKCSVSNQIDSVLAPPKKLPFVSLRGNVKTLSQVPDQTISLGHKDESPVLLTDNTSSAYNTGESFSSSSITNKIYDTHPQMVTVPSESGVFQRQNGFHRHQDKNGDTKNIGRQSSEASDDALSPAGGLSGLQSSAECNRLNSPPPNCKQTPVPCYPSKTPDSIVTSTSEKNRNGPGNQLRKTSRHRISSAGAGPINNTVACPGDKARRHKSSSDAAKADSCGTGNASSDPSAEWKVRVRSDGTRYVTKRTTRERILKEREERLTKERTGLTTDDDVMTELKLGRHWSKQERKKHLDRVRDYKRRKHFMEQSRLGALRESANEEDIVQLSNKKMLKHNNRKILDNFMTVQEILAHGSRSVDDATQNHLLNVTYI